MKYKDFDYVIIVDDENKPMSYSKSDGQLCYCDDENWEDDIHPIKIISKQTAKRHIRLDREYRKALGLIDDRLGLKLMPVRV